MKKIFKKNLQKIFPKKTTLKIWVGKILQKNLQKICPKKTQKIRVGKK